MSPWPEEGEEAEEKQGRVITSRTVWRGVIVLAFLLGCAALVLAAILSNRQTETNNRQTVIVQHNHHVIHKIDGALCALRGDLQQRVDQTNQFLRHPEEFPQFNDPATLALIQSQVNGQRRTINALSVLSCRE